MSEGFWFGLVLVIIPAAAILAFVATYLWSRALRPDHDAGKHHRAAAMRRHPSSRPRAA
jgi:hypothetical protein